ncbi:Signal transduction histidine kinase CheA [Cystobacter fuscus DSM 2262]|uniref:Chemotaxis protein CheA n=1 Tax=Cystobacter fuscus (strain ATCC 25194 / DSM 2262 / NBRC 100088 / M29) TaxID=1242864 RepID=S9NVC8_CYSF2|nr:chemotaxis protein CheA [Cystobacter fuscus]EPX56100.1 Signal transduction histidine kinase CheA [Cystobacter fuscus DSM 2262]
MDLDREQLLATFAEESEELLTGMEEILVSLEEHPDQERLRSIFRAAHSVKGAAGALGFSGMTDVAHVLEDVLETLLERRPPVSDEHVTLLLATVDRLRELLQAVLAGQERPAQEDAGLVARLRNCCESLRQQESRRGVFTRPAEESAVEVGGRRGRTLRVDVEKLDRIAILTGELAIARTRLAQVLSTGTAEEAQEVHHEADRLHEELQEEVMRVRMVPVGPLFRQHLRTVRDLTRVERKWARLVLEGEDVEVDTALVEGLREPLLHLVRNAVDHGLETPEERRAAGKEACGTLVLRAFHEPGSLVVELSDDGRGLRYARLREKARELGMEPGRMTVEELEELIFLPGLSTAEAVTEVSGRGVGMDVVRRSVEALRGLVSLRSEEGKGTTVTLRVPLTLASIQGFSVGVGEETYVLPLAAVRECLELPAERQGQSGAGLLSLRGRSLPYLRLREVLGVDGPVSARESVVVLGHGGSRAGLVVDALYGEGPCVLKPLGRLFRHLPGVSGSTILGSGRVGLVLDVPTLLRTAIRQRAAMG